MILEKYPLDVFLKHILPVLLFLFLGFMCLFLRSEDLDHKLRFAILSFVCMLIFHLNNYLKICYLTYFDKFMLINYIALILALGFAVLNFIMSRRLKKTKIDGGVCFAISIIIPVAWFLAQAALAYLTFV